MPDIVDMWPIPMLIFIVVFAVLITKYSSPAPKPNVFSPSPGITCVRSSGDLSCVSTPSDGGGK